MQQLVHLLNEYLVQEAYSEGVGDAIATVRHAVHAKERRTVGTCPWCLEDYRKPHAHCMPGKRKPMWEEHGEEPEDEGADGGA